MKITHSYLHYYDDIRQFITILLHLLVSWRLTEQRAEGYSVRANSALP